MSKDLSLAARSKQPKCIAINGDVRIFIEQANSFVYPDAMVICGDIKSFPSDEHSIVNPLLIVEVLSKSTESYDRGDKFHKYFSLTSLREYVLIDQYKPVVDFFYREDASYLKMTTYIGLKQSVYLTSLDFSIPMADIYRNVQDLEAPPI